MNTTTVIVHAQLATMDASVAGAYGALRDHAVVVSEGKISAVTPMAELKLSADAQVIDAQGRWVTPGLIDCHSHVVFGGTRVHEWEKRLCGVPYTEIARQGGGILNSVRATRALSEDELLAVSSERVKTLMWEGVTCLEIKSGYGLSTDEEFKMLRVAKRLGQLYPIEISPTLLAAHAVPPEYQGRADDYVELIIREMIPQAKNQQLLEAVDVFCETIGFTVEQCDRIWSAARQHGLAVKGHVEQLSPSRGTVTLARHQPWSSDHLEYLDQQGVDALAQCGGVAVLLPGAYYFMREKTMPPVKLLQQAGVPLAVATDMNPGTSPFCSLRLAMNMACVLFGLTPEEALLGTTRHAARALGRSAHSGTVATGKVADLLIWNIDHPAEIVCSLGVNPLVHRMFRGQLDDSQS